MRFVLIALILLMSAPIVTAHNGGAIPADVWTHWNTDEFLFAGLLLPTYLYVRGMLTYVVARWRIVCFVSGIAILFVALISPLEAVSGALFSGHMVQHLLLVLVAAPLLVFSRPIAPILRGLPSQWRKWIGQIVRVRWPEWTHSVTAAAVLHIASLMVWHIPVFYSTAINSFFTHMLEHLSFFLTALWFWWGLGNNREHGVRILAVFGAMMTSGLLGALMTFSPSPWYLDHLTWVSAWGLTPLEDQQLAGLFMWIPTGVVYVVTAALILSGWLNTVEQRSLKREQLLMKEVSDA